MTFRAGRPGPGGSAGGAGVARTAATGVLVGMLLAGCSTAAARSPGRPVVDAPGTQAPVEPVTQAPVDPTSAGPPVSAPTRSPSSAAAPPMLSAGPTSPLPDSPSQAGSPGAATATIAAATTASSATAQSTSASTGQVLTSPADAVSYSGDPDVGALFDGSTAGTHGCSASVVDSPGRDLLATAAHCVSGTGSGLEFVPGYLDGTSPYGTWSVVAAFADPSWISDQAPTADIVFLRVAPHITGTGAVNIEDVVGADILASAPAVGMPVTVDGYATGAYDRPITCTAIVSDTQGYPTFGCGGFVAGTSGGPWLRPHSTADNATDDNATDDNGPADNPTPGTRPAPTSWSASSAA